MNDLTHNRMSLPFSFDGSREHGVLVIHGFTGTPGEVLPLGTAIAGAGLRVEGVCLPGHGTTPRDMSTARWRDWLSCVLNAFDALAEECKKVSVVGLSMGGTLALLLAERRPVYRAVPIAAALRVWNKWASLAPFFRWIKPYYTEPRKNPPPEVAASYEGFLHPYKAGYDCIPLRSMGDLNRLRAMARRDLEKITCPMLVVEAGMDQTVHPKSAAWIMDRAVNAEREKLLLPASPHVCTLGKERALLFKRVIGFLTGRPAAQTHDGKTFSSL